MKFLQISSRLKKLFLKNKLISFFLAGFVVFSLAIVAVKKENIAVYVSKIPALINREEATPKKKNNLPQGRQVYSIMQPEGSSPKILQAIIDPPDVHVGDKQTLTIIIDSGEKVSSVIAITKTDTKEIVLPLMLKEKEKTLFGTRNYDTPGLVYEASWRVEDTHDTTYYTKFEVVGEAGQKNSINLAWTDACGIANSGAWTSTGDCTISSLDGVQNGNGTISAGHTLTLNAPFVYSPGNSLVINGAIALGVGGEIKEGYLGQRDADSDGYADNTTQVFSSTPIASTPTGPDYNRPRSLLQTAQYDCDATSAGVYPGVVTSQSQCSCSYPDICSNFASGTQQTTTCTASGTYAVTSGSCTCGPRGTDGTWCGTTYGGAAGACTQTGGGCSTSGLQSTYYYNHTCQNSACVQPASPTGTTNVGCTFNPNGLSCGASTACSYGSTCSNSGTQTTYTCNAGGSCISNIVSCGTRNTNGTSCGTTTYSCSSGTQSSTTTYQCSNAVCQSSTSQTQCSCSCNSGSGQCNVVYSCARCSYNYQCAFATFNSCTSNCNQMEGSQYFNINYTTDNSCNNLCTNNTTCSNGLCGSSPIQ